MANRDRHPSAQLVYAAIIADIQVIGREHGYAIAVHGSMRTDLDLIAAPWVYDAKPAEDLVDAIAEYIGGSKVHNYFNKANHWKESPEEKPHGRLAWSIWLNPDLQEGPYIDISVMPRAPEM